MSLQPEPVSENRVESDQIDERVTLRTVAVSLKPDGCSVWNLRLDEDCQSVAVFDLLCLVYRVVLVLLPPPEVLNRDSL